MAFFKKATVAYIGDNYAGWQRQKNATSVQNVIEAVLSQIYNAEVLIFGAGRTDTGVHALAQTFHFQAKKQIENNKLQRALNALLPEDIRILKVEECEEDFHAMRSALSKTYEYRIYNSPISSPFLIKRALWIRNKIDTDKLEAILKLFQGEHDFSSFCVKKTKKEYTHRRINFIKVESNGCFEEGREIKILINANGFLHNMVRIIIGSSLDLLQTDNFKEELANIFASKDRRRAGKTAPAYGLYQKEIIYGSSQN